MITESDVVVVGIGAAGIAAAITAHDAGAEVVVIEKMPPERAGGNSRVSGQVWFSPRDVEAAKTYFTDLAGEFPVPESLVQAWAVETARNTDWMRERLAEARGRVYRDEADPYPADATEVTSISHADAMKTVGWMDASHYEYPEVRGNECGTEFNFIGPGMGYSRLWYTLKACLDQRGIAVYYDAPAGELVRERGGRVLGVVVTPSGADPFTVSARKAVILASGGFAASDEMGRNYLRLSYVTPWGSPANTGDGIRMAQKIGADLAHPYNYMGQPGIRLPGYEVGEGTHPAGPAFINVGADGRRFMDETIPTRHGKARMRGSFDFYPGFPMWTVFDETARLAGPLAMSRAVYAGGWMKQIERYDWSEDNSAEIERGWITRAETLRSLAAKLGVDADGLEAEVREYNACASDGREPVPSRPRAAHVPLERGPYYGYRWGQLMITTLGGVRKDHLARALDPDGTPIAGLYCAGDVASSYSWALAGGAGLADAIAFARIAGRGAAALSAEEGPVVTAAIG